MHYAFHYADLGVLEGWPISGRKRFYMEAIIILYHEHHITISIQFKYVFSRVGKTLPTPQLLGHWATAPIAL